LFDVIIGDKQPQENKEEKVWQSREICIEKNKWKSSD
jgi:hypothetical protein